MKLAILGTDSDIVDLAAAARDANHEIVWLGDVRPQDTAAIAPFTTGLADRAGQWELLLDRAISDAVLVGRGTAPSELRAERIKRIVTEGVPLLVVHPAFESVLPYYEIDMTRRESGDVVQHYNPLIGHPIASQLADWVRVGHPTIGPIHQLTCERRLVTAMREDALAQFARDIELLAAIAGDIRRVTAIGPADDAASFASLQIQMTAGGNASLRWSVACAPTAGAGMELSLLGEHGIATLQIPDVAGSRQLDWQLEISELGVRKSEHLEPYDSARAAIERLASTVGGSITAQAAAASTWDSATRAMEVVDAAELSRQKGRTMEVYQQQLTERLAFRGTMAAIGCGLLLVAFAAVVVVGLLGGAEGIVRQRLAPSWPLVLFAVLAFFLLLQAVPLLAGKTRSTNDESQPKTGG
jgi:hypothetical protein